MALESKNILYLSYDGLTDPLGQSQILPYLVGLSKLGYSINVISFEKKSFYIRNSDFVTEICKENNIVWNKLNYNRKPPIVSTVYDLYSMWRKATFLIKSNNISLVHCRSYLTALIGEKLKLKFNIKFIFDMRGFWADERVEGNIWNLSNPLYRIIYNYFKKKESSFLINSDAIISLTENGKSEILSWNLRIPQNKITVIPCCVDTNFFNPTKLNSKKIEELKSSKNIKDNINILTYVGSIGTWYLLFEMLLFFKRYLLKYEHAVFLFITQDAPEEIFKIAKRLNISFESIIVTYATRKEMPTYISLSTHSIFFIKPSYSKKASSPTKQAEIMAMGIPLICNDGVGDTSFIVQKYNSGIICENFTDQEFDRVLEKLSKSQFNSNKMISSANNSFSAEVGIASYASIYYQFYT